MRRENGSVIGVDNTPTTSVASGVWSLFEQARYQKEGVWPGPPPVGEPYFNYTTLLLHGDGTNGAQNNTILDTSTNNITITRNGNLTQGTLSPFSQEDGKWSVYFDGSGDYLSIADNAALDLSGDFCIEFWLNVDSGNVFRSGVIGHRNQSTWIDGTDWVVRVETTDGKIGFGYNTAGNYYDMGTYTIGEWAHYAITRSGTSIKTFKNGTQVATATSSSTFSSSDAMLIGRNVSGYDYKGYISNLRIIKGLAVYSNNFTPSTTPLTAISGTSLLVCGSGGFKDNSSNNFAITVSGNTSIQPLSPFAPSTIYSAATKGGSAYFDGSGDYLSIAASNALDFGTGNFTFEVWLYIPSGGSGAGQLLTLQPASGSNFFQWFIDNSNGSTTWGINNIGNFGTSGGVKLNAWTHLALTRNGNTLRQYTNGVKTYENTSFTYTIGSASQPAFIGRDTGAYNNYLRAYLSNFRLVKAGDVYDPAGFTPPAQPLTSIASTSLLLNFTNAGILDNTGRNVLETVGNAQISTSVKKFGTGSMYFDGTTDYLKPTSLTDLAFGTGDFTIEFWLYLNTASVEQWCVAWTGPSTCTIYFNSGTIRWFANGALRITGASLSATTWYHIALTRENGSTKLFVDGTQSGSTYADTNSYVPTAYAIGATTTGTASLNGYIDDLRITKGVARYTANFTPPTAAFEDQ